MSRSEHLKGFQYSKGVSGNPEGRPPAIPDDIILAAWVASQNEWTSSASITETLGIKRDTLYRIRRAKYPRANRLVRERFGVEPQPIDRYTPAGSWAKEGRVLGRSFVAQECPPLPKLMQQIAFYEKKRSVPGLEKTTVVTLEDALVNKARNN